MVKVYEKNITEFQPDSHNANQGTERGTYMIRQSLQSVGAGRSLVSDKNDVIPAGNKTLEALVDTGFETAIVVETDGTKPVIVKRTDWDLTDEDMENPARQYAYYDNRASEVGLSWNPEVMQFDLDSGIDLSSMFRDSEIQEIIDAVDYTVPEPTKQKEPELIADHFIEIYCSDSDLNEIGETLREWGSRQSVTINIS